MKKKASLLISGITTVAMLAVAVGSFAAWDNLTGETKTLTATSGDPVILKVESSATGADENKTLVPSGAALGNNDKEEVSVGTLTATLTKDGTATNTDTTKTDKVDISCATPTVKIGGEDKSSLFDVTLYNGETPVDLTNSKLTSGKAYTVKVKYKEAKGNDAITDEETAAVSSKLMNIELVVSAAKK